MKCPRCRKEIAVEAVSHGCGWRVGVGGENAARVLQEERATPEQVEGHLAAICAKLGARRAKDRPALGEEKRRAKVPLLTDVGHGDRCVCEGCWAARRDAPSRGFATLPEPGHDVQPEVATGQKQLQDGDAR